MAISNEGIELEAELDIFRQSAVSWRMKLNASRNGNRFEKAYNGKDPEGLVIGRPVYGIYAFASEGFYESDEEVPVYYDIFGNKKYFGNNIIIDEPIKYEWARIPHFYSNFYVYKYATGITSAICIATKILSNEKGFVEKYINMLKLGCTKKSLELLKLVDVDLENIETYEVVKNYYNNKIEELKKLNERIKDGE